MAYPDLGASAGAAAASGAADDASSRLSDRCLIVNVEFNPVVLRVIGNLKPTTRDKLREVLPKITTSAPGSSTHVTFELQRDATKPHWVAEIPGSYCSYELGMVRWRSRGAGWAWRVYV